METVAIIAFVVLMVGIPALLVNRDLVVGKLKGRRQHSVSALPFLFFPTTGPTTAPPPVPAWHTRSGSADQLERSIEAEAGTADLSPQPEPGIADLPDQDSGERAGWDRAVPFESAEDARIRARDWPHR